MNVFLLLESHLRFKRADGSVTFKNKAYCRKYWVTRGIEFVYDWLIHQTSFLPDNTSVSVRFYFIEHNITSIPSCPVCSEPINIPKTYSACIPITHNRCVRAFTDSKIKATNLKKYGGNPMHNDCVRERYCASVSKIDTVERARKALNTRKLKNSEYGKRAEATAEKRLIAKKHKTQGYQFSQQLHIPIEVVGLINNKDWLVEQYTTKTAKQIARELGVNKTTIQNRLHAFNISTIKRYSSDIENEIAEFVESLGHTITRNVVVSGLDFEIDIFLPHLNIGIEYHGLYWHTEQRQPRKNIHNYKHKQCLKNGILLIQIWADEWETKREIVVSRLCHIVGSTTHSVYARQCVVREITTKEASNFINTYHIQGYVGARYKFGLFYNNKLVAAMTFGKCRFNKKIEWELIRFCSSCSVVGGASKLFTHFVRYNHPISIISYSNNRYGNGSTYEKIGMKYMYDTAPDYYYVPLSNTLKTYHRSHFQKHKLHKLLPKFDPTLTEYENMLNNGYDRIWDCGNKVFVWNKPIS